MVWSNSVARIKEGVPKLGLMMNDVSIKMTALCHRDVWCVTVAQKFMKRETKKVFFNEWISKFWNCILKPLFFWRFEIKKSWNGNGKAFKSDPLRKFNFGVMHFFLAPLLCYHCIHFGIWAFFNALHFLVLGTYMHSGEHDLQHFGVFWEPFCCSVLPLLPMGFCKHYCIY